MNMPVTLFRGDISQNVMDALLQSGRVAMDTETSGLDWRLDRLELCQMFTPEVGAILLQRDDAHVPANFLRVLAEPSATKVFHHAPFDLKFIQATWGVRAQSVQCTKAASKLLNPRAEPSAHSLGSLLHANFGITLNKGQVRVSDWGAVTLSAEQVDYAAADVVHLLRLADGQQARLRGSGQADDYRAICAYLPVQAHLEVAGIPDPFSY